jgi:bacterioferritin-associated ferredoxin
MIVCHCNRIDHREIEAAADDLTKADPWRVLTPVLVYRALGKRPRCGCCLSLAANIIHTRKLGASCCKRCPVASLVTEDAQAAEPIPIDPVTVEAVSD